VKFLADESVDRAIVERLRQLGHRVWYLAEMEPGSSDDAVLGLANQEKAVLLTADKDFAELVFRQRRLASGVILIRLAGLSSERKADVVVSTIAAHLPEFPQAFAVVTPGAIRIRQQRST